MDKKNTTQVNFRIDKDLLDKIDKIAESKCIGRTTFIRNAIVSEEEKFEKEKWLEKRRFVELKKHRENIEPRIKSLESKKKLTANEKGELFDLIQERDAVDMQIAEIQAKEYFKQEQNKWEEDFNEERKKFIDSYKS